LKPTVHPIEARSYEIMECEVDFSRWSPGARDLVKRMVHATADDSFAQTALVGDSAVGALIGALRSRTAVVCDANMVVAGVPAVAAACPVVCYLGASIETTAGGTRSAAAVDRAAHDHPDGAVWVFGNAPTALVRLVELHAGGVVTPSAVIALPVGYVGAAESKQSLWDSPLRSVAITNRGRRGGSAAAAAALNAAWRLCSQ
jgi:precorrin-8X/cobalt-precorrin-8 methylmutase